LEVLFFLFAGLRFSKLSYIASSAPELQNSSKIQNYGIIMFNMKSQNCLMK